MDAPPLNFDADPVMPFRLRDYQKKWIEQIDADRKILSRLLVDACGGCGKSTVFAALAFNEWTQRGGRTLVLENRDKLVHQTANRIRNETGLEVDVEQADSHASPMAPIVVASVQTLGRINRLTGFSEDHFSLVVPDECHASLAAQWQRVMWWFHLGAESLVEDFEPPPDGTYTVKAHIVGFTATADLGSKKRDLGHFFQKKSVVYPYLKAVEDGWLVPPVAERCPISIESLRGIRKGRSANGTDYLAEDLSAAMLPIVGELADQIVKFASNRKTIAFTPSVECARLLAVAVAARGLKSIFVSGECLDVDEKTEAFAAAGPGTVLTNCAIYVAGLDIPDIDCVAWFRPTVSRVFFLQGLFRATRTLPGLVNDDMTAAERRQAIADSPKSEFIVIDPLWRLDDISLCSVHDLVTDKPEVKAKMIEFGERDLIADAEKASRDWEKALQKAAKKHARKAAERIDPLKWALTIDEKKITEYRPETEGDRRPLSPGQTEYLDRNRIDRTAITTFGLAQKIIGIHVHRFKLGRATMGQLELLLKFGLGDQVTPLLSAADASHLIDGFKKGH